MRKNRAQMVWLILLVGYQFNYAGAQHPLLPARDFTYAFSSNCLDAVQHPQVVPPLPGLTIPQQTFTLMLPAKNSVKILTGTSTFLIIPPDAFETVNGKPYFGPVTITYREFKNPLDIFLSGIPMGYDSAGKKELFQSAGMFDIDAKANNMPLKLKKGKNIEVGFVPVDQDQYHFYRLNERDGNWTHLRPLHEQTENIKSTVNQNSRNQNNRSIETPVVSNIPDTTCFINRYKDTKRYFYFDAGQKGSYIPSRVYYAQRRVFPEGRAVESEHVYVRKNRALFRLIPIVNTQKKVEFIQLVEVFDNSTIFYELRAFHIRKWALEKAIPVDEFIKRYKNGRRYHDLRVIYTPGDKVCLFELKNQNGFSVIQLNIQKSISNNEQDKRAIQRFSRYYSKYCIMMQNKENAFNRKIMLRYANYLASIRKNTRDSAYHTANMLFSISSLGIYNCDQVYRMFAPITVTPSFVIPETGVLFKQVAVVDKAANAAFWFSNPTFTISAVNTIAFIVQGDNNKLYYVSKEDIPKINQPVGTIPIPLHPIAADISKSELAAIMGLSPDGTVLAQNK